MSEKKPQDEQLSEWLDGRLEPEEARRLEEQLRGAGRLDELSRLARTVELVRQLPAEGPPAGLNDRIKAALDEPVTRQEVTPFRRILPWLLSAGVAAAAALVLMITLNQGKSDGGGADSPVAQELMSPSDRLASLKEKQGKSNRKMLSVLKEARKEEAEGGMFENKELASGSLKKKKSGSGGIEEHARNLGKVGPARGGKKEGKALLDDSELTPEKKSPGSPAGQEVLDREKQAKASAGPASALKPAKSTDKKAELKKGLSRRGQAEWKKNQAGSGPGAKPAGKKDVKRNQRARRSGAPRKADGEKGKKGNRAVTINRKIPSPVGKTSSTPSSPRPVKAELKEILDRKPGLRARSSGKGGLVPKAKQKTALRQLPGRSFLLLEVADFADLKLSELIGVKVTSSKCTLGKEQSAKKESLPYKQCRRVVLRGPQAKVNKALVSMRSKVKGIKYITLPLPVLPQPAKGDSVLELVVVVR